MKSVKIIPNLRLLVFLAGLILCLSSANAGPDGKLEKDDLVAICGDSITEQRNYSALMEQYLVMCQPTAGLNAMQFGWGGEKASGLAMRLNGDVLPFRPTVATTCYGMNDGGYKPVDVEIAKEYRRQMQGVIKQLKKAEVRFIVVGSPGVVDPATFKKPGVTADEYNQTLAGLATVAKEIADAEGVTFADIHTVMMESMTKAKQKYGADYQIAPDGIHPFGNGHLLMAYAFLKALGCDGNIGTITYDYSSGKAFCDAAQTITGVTNGNIEVESTRYPFCFTGEPGPTTTRTMSEFVPFNQDLNRYLLIVKNAPAQAKVTWGNESHIYSREQLGKGVNLAADFVDHPFKAFFQEIATAIQKQQTFEVAGIKVLLHSLASSKYLLPDDGGKFDDLATAIQKRDLQLRQDISASVKPVKHSIKIEPAS